MSILSLRSMSVTTTKSGAPDDLLGHLPNNVGKPGTGDQYLPLDAEARLGERSTVCYFCVVLVGTVGPEERLIGVGDARLSKDGAEAVGRGAEENGTDSARIGVDEQRLNFWERLAGIGLTGAVASASTLLA